MKISTLFALGLLAAAPLAAQAQGRLPRTSPSEQSYTEINRDLQRREQVRGAQHQNQFEVNQLRQELNRQELFAPPPGATGIRICAPGQIGC